MALDRDQRGTAHGILLAVIAAALIITIGWLLGPPLVPPLPNFPARLAYALKADLFILLWLLLAVAIIATKRFKSPVDIAGSAFGPPSTLIAVDIAFLQNTLEQVVLAVGADLVLSALLRGQEMVLIPLHVLVFCIGRLAFRLGYAGGARGRSFGFSLTFHPTLAAYLLAIVLLILRG